MAELGPKNESVPENLYEIEQSIGNGDKRLEIKKYTDWAADNLKDRLGIENLSTIEGTYLRNTVERLMPKIKEEKKLANNGEMSSLHVTEFEEEAATLWLYDLYGIHPKDIPHTYIVEDENENTNYNFENALRSDARKKYEELKSEGHNVHFHSKIPDDFKEYIRRLREKTNHE